MPGTSTKSVNLFDKQIPATPSIDVLRAHRVAGWNRWRNVAAAQDTIVGASRRVVGSVTRKGSNTQPVPTSVANAVSQTGPTWALWREIAHPRIRVTPGCYLAARILYVPSGMTQRFVGSSDWDQDGARARVRFTVNYSLGGYANNSNLFEVQLEGSPLANGQFATPPQPTMLRTPEIQLLPNGLLNDNAVGRDLAEWCLADVQIEASGGFRIVDLVLFERPWYHAQDDAATNQSVHAYVVQGQVPQQPVTRGPQTRAPDGATYTERRFGHSKLEEVARRQTQLLGPAILEWSGWEPNSADLTSSAFTSYYRTTNSTSLVDAFDSGHTSWNANHPGWHVEGGAHHLPWAQNDPEYAADGGTGIIPVTVGARVAVQNVAATGTLRLQSSAAEFVELTFANTTAGWTYGHGYLACQSKGDQPDVGNLMAFLSTSNALYWARVYNIAVWYGHHATS